MTTPRERVLIIGAAGRDFRNVNAHFRDHPWYEVVAFTAGQLPNICAFARPADRSAESRVPRRWLTRRGVRPLTLLRVGN